MYIRFVVSELNQHSNQKLGIFHGLRYLRNDGGLLSYELEHAERILNWFNTHLESPIDYLNKQKLKKSDIYINWFKVSASTHIAKAREFAFFAK